MEPGNYLMGQPYVKEPEKTVQDILNELNEKLSERVRITRFERYE